MGEEQVLVTEVPSSLKQLARLVVRGFYSIEDTLIIDMLVRNPCMKEDDLCELLKFEKKMLRARISTLKNDKFLQVRLKMETGEDGKAQKVNYYFINYKTFVNVVKYKLDLMRKRMETEERDATSRASFKCPKCSKTFTDLEADQLFDPMTGEFRCTYCREIVEEDLSALPKKDSRMQLARFNSQLEPLYELLRQVEGIRLAPEVLEPEPVDINTIRGLDTKRFGIGNKSELWSGEATRSQGFVVEETRVDVTIGEKDVQPDNAVRKDQPVWMVESTVITHEDPQTEALVGASAEVEKATTTSNPKNSDDIMSVLLAHEKRGGDGTALTAAAVKAALPDPSDSSDGEQSRDESPTSPDVAEMMDSDDEELVPVIKVGEKSIPITEVDDTLIAEMTPQEKETYIQIYQEYYSHMYD
ncbi:general transcription factor IIE subunit 1 [Halyomorpha halys]|uniref:general transcription factor IIE subunit 1 n=1 Tax=Halyomorpha halys TaxID=286706 RepID=UPI0006D4C941|nr:general transcription factor IIE subunit 1 [Halyomorpha halys]